MKHMGYFVILYLISKTEYGKIFNGHHKCINDNCDEINIMMMMVIKMIKMVIMMVIRLCNCCVRHTLQL